MSTIHTTPEHERIGQKLRVVFFVDVVEGGERGFREAYRQIRESVVGTPGHLLDQLGEPVDGSRRWVITSEWETPEHFFTWQQSEEHQALVAPLRVWVERTESLRFRIVEETGGGLS
ncbi:antibiotic biosynthesis monooxygenase [Streptomyces sp. LX-29]|uniref:antibiotic biosynthesis monooxygenase family protein n=1 Tax=Streptomyces sp. LX-29 TaxID=2900152 RepID=UPI00240DEE65|nr:antibiotic biosynthesis monooxygenase family protein [Streptomyces sp. LX-29]WFB08581.1 antibiotic biosynthesis monooxygenase [Streptomyces sp. LX-29]